MRPSIPPAAWLTDGFERYVRRLAQRHFAAVHLRRPADGAALPADLPILFVANHTNWWDGLLAFLAGRALGTTFHVLMEARHLARYRFFLRVGALPLDRASAAGAYADLERAAATLVPGNGLWVFPQGARRPAGEPLTPLESGAAHLALRGRTPVRLTPVGLRYLFLGEQRPEAFIWVGAPWVVHPGDSDRRTLTHRVGERMSAALGDLERAVLAEDLAPFQPLVPGSLSLNKRLDRWRHRLGLLDGRFEDRNG